MREQERLPGGREKRRKEKPPQLELGAQEAAGRSYSHISSVTGGGRGWVGEEAGAIVGQRQAVPPVGGALRE